ncbi:hypothetical protein [Ralstonia solanacearum]|uniref:hypothetical protein n=1 Tax=Ralstonia solanacearum TaxID=305 RepID=UPI0005AD0603|nr:hypothetical protein [Ralstonia solanacearum]MDC6177095.1 hypothetical protein [Ralstonia solanacearum]MDC6238373.1 hypothetical protein [Ralstonia solanacearum]
MKRAAAWSCAAIATLLAGGILYWYGISLVSVLVALILLACPVWVIWMSLRLSRQSRREIQAMVKRELDARRKSSTWRQK